MTLQKTLGPAQMRGDSSSLRLAIGNLLENAIKYGREGGLLARLERRSAPNVAD